MKTLTVAALAAVCLLAVSAEPEPEADPGYHNNHRVVVGHNGFRGGSGSRYGGYSGYGGYTNRGKRSADPEADAEPGFPYGGNGYNTRSNIYPVYSSYGGSGGFRGKRSADPSYDSVNSYTTRRYSYPVPTIYNSNGRWKRSADPEAEAEPDYNRGFVGRSHFVDNNFGHQGFGYSSGYNYGK